MPKEIFEKPGLASHASCVVADYPFPATVEIYRYDQRLPAPRYIYLASQNLGLRFRFGRTYTVTMTIQADYSTRVEISDGTATEVVLGAATCIDFVLDQFHISDHGSLNSNSFGAGDYLLRFDDIKVTQAINGARSVFCGHTVQIDIKPGSSPNSINLGSNGTVPVAIFSSPDFDARTIDPTSLTLAGAGVQLKGKGTLMYSFSDENADGLLDLVVHIVTEALQLSDSDIEAVLEGRTFGGVLIRGVDSVRVVP